MIRTPTVFVLGAGASKDFGFPIGFELVQQVRNTLGPDGNIRNAFLEVTQFEGDHVDAFINALAMSGQNSVDAFLEHRRDFMDIGKAAMAMILVRCEQQGSLFDILPIRIGIGCGNSR